MTALQQAAVLDGHQVAQTLTAAGGDSNDFPFVVHAAAGDGAPHVLVTIGPSESWAAMPGSAVRAAIAQHLARHADALGEAGYGVATWEHRCTIAVLIVAATPDAVEAEAPAVRAYLAALNPELPEPEEPEPWKP